MKKLALLGLSLIALACCAACGSGSATRLVAQGSFDAGSLQGQYAYYLTGTDLATGELFAEAGTFVADGNHNITAGTDDFNETGLQLFNTPTTGTYQINTDGSGTITLNRSPLVLGSVVLSVTLISPSQLFILGADGSSNSYGMALLQQTAALAAPPSGSFAFRMHSQRPASVGAIGDVTITGGAVVSGSQDQNSAGATTLLTLTGGTFDPPDANGRGTATITDSSLVSSRFFYYVIDANTFFVLFQDLDVIGVGHAEKQSGGFTDLSLFGNYAFGSRGETFVGGARTVGRFAADGVGNISLGAFDSVRDGGTLAATFSSGTYSPMSPNGRTAVTLNASTGIVEAVFRMVSPTRAFLLFDDGTKIEDGTIDAQTVATFTDATMNGQFSFVMDGFDATSFLDRVGTLRWDGQRNLQFSHMQVRNGAISGPVVVGGTYQVDSNGRTTGTVPGFSDNLIFYLVSSNKAYILQADVNTEVDGSMSLQQ
jgi:hypothetical protein